MSGLVADVRATAGDLVLDVELAVPPGSTVAVLGPNGAGKTTLLRVLAGLHPLDDGDVVLDGDSLVGVSPEARGVGVVFQDHALFPHLSALDNVAFGLRCRGMRRAEATTQAAAWLGRVGLGDRTHVRPAALSGGEAQRVALARALATVPRMLLLDEPMAALDATTRLTTRRDLVRHLADHDGVRLVVTHDPLEAIALADHLVVLERGRVVQRGTAAELTARPATAYVADLVGVNLLPGVLGADGMVTVEGSDVRLTTPEPAPAGPVAVVFHPRAVALHRTCPEGSPRNVWPGEAVGVDAERDRARIRIRLGPRVEVVAEVTTAAADELQLAAGGPVWASVKATDVTVTPR